MNQNSEQFAREAIDRMLLAVGWIVQSKARQNFSCCNEYSYYSSILKQPQLIQLSSSLKPKTTKEQCKIKILKTDKNEMDVLLVDKYNNAQNMNAQCDSVFFRNIATVLCQVQVIDTTMTIGAVGNCITRASDSGKSWLSKNSLQYYSLQALRFVTSNFGYSLWGYKKVLKIAAAYYQRRNRNSNYTTLWKAFTKPLS